MANASSDLSAILQQLANSGTLPEISKASGAVRHHIYWHGSRNPSNNRLRKSMLFLVYQTTRHGPQNGFRLVLVREGFRITLGEEGVDEEDEVERLEREIPMGCVEVVVLGPKIAAGG
ncbi:hypothetical protein G7Y79_00025g057780 [Physcia stellaris]|nr:hypothetical protein G7Y79_00025g057780 [Physcia stellaris]